MSVLTANKAIYYKNLLICRVSCTIKLVFQSFLKFKDFQFHTVFLKISHNEFETESFNSWDIDSLTLRVFNDESLLGQACSQVHEVNWVGLGSSGSQSRLSDTDSGKPAFISHTLRPMLLEPLEAVPTRL